MKFSFFTPLIYRTMAYLFTFLALFSTLPTHAEQLFRIGTGAVSGTYHPLGKALAQALSEPGLLSLAAQSSNGSIANVSAVGGGDLESGFSQADVASWHYSGTGMVRAKSKIEKLRLIASLYPESVHVVVRRSLGITTIAGLKGKHVGMDEPGSGVLVNARQILAAHGLSERDIKPAYLKGAQTISKMKDGSLDAFFFVGGVPSSVVAQIAAAVDVDLLPIAQEQITALRTSSPFFAPQIIATDAYKGVAGVQTLAVGAQWITSANADEALVYKLTKKLFTPETLKQLELAHSNGKLVQLKTATDGAGIPLHPGAERFYKEAGVLK
jgi:uncharacterized protein